MPRVRRLSRWSQYKISRSTYTNASTETFWHLITSLGHQLYGFLSSRRSDAAAVAMVMRYTVAGWRVRINIASRWLAIHFRRVRDNDGKKIRSFVTAHDGRSPGVDAAASTAERPTAAEIISRPPTQLVGRSVRRRRGGISNCTVDCAPRFVTES